MISALMPTYGRADIALSARMNGQRLSLDGQIDGFAAFLAGTAVPVSAAAQIGEAA